MVHVKRAFLLFLLLTPFIRCLGQSDTTQRIVPGRHNDPAQGNKPYVILISIDGMRYDYLTKYHAVNLLRLAQQGATAQYMLSVYPTLTFPNHYSMVTGLYPAHHGIVDNSFFDRKTKSTYNFRDQKKVGDSSWYGGTPLWALAEQQKLLTASFYWVGSEAAIMGQRPAYYYLYNERIRMERRLQVVKDWLQLPEDKRPHLITFYMPEVDHAGHVYGPDSPETESAVSIADETIGKLAAMIDPLHLPVNFIVVSDHGMANTDTEHPLLLPPTIRDTSLCKVVSSPALLHVYAKDKKNIAVLSDQLRRGSDGYDIYLRDETPPGWHHRTKDDRFDRIGDLIVVARFPKFFKIGNGPPIPGKHGFDPALPEMRGVFLAWGPGINKVVLTNPFENIDIFPLVTELLGLSYQFKIDGNPETLRALRK